jgi:integrase
MPKTKLTKKAIDALPQATNRKGEKHYDLALNCFGVLVYPSGTKSFFIEYGTRGHRKIMTLGKYGHLTLEQARNLAKKKLAGVIDGEDPLEDRRDKRKMPTFGEWVDSYLEEVVARKKRPKEDQRYLGQAKQEWGSRPLDSITTDDVKKIFQGIAQKGKKPTANRWLASVRACLQEAWRTDKIPSNPAMKVRPMPENPPRDRVLSDEEFAKLLDAINDEEILLDLYARAAFRLLVETGARLSEVLRARWEDVDLDGMIWRLPSTKAGKPQVVPLLPGTVSMLANLDRVGPYVIPGKDPENPRFDLKRPWAKLQKTVGIEDASIHDLRRTFGLQIAKTAGLHAASKLLRHSDIRVTEQVYAPLGLDDLRDALEKREKVVPMRRKKTKAKSRGATKS